MCYITSYVNDKVRKYKLDLMKLDENKVSDLLTP